MASNDITGRELSLLAAAPEKTERDSDVSVASMVCPRCGASPKAKCRSKDGSTMARAHSERNQKMYAASRVLAEEVIMGFVNAAVANGDAVTVMFKAMSRPVEVAGIEGYLVAKANDRDLDLCSVLLYCRKGEYRVLQVNSEDVHTTH